MMIWRFPSPALPDLRPALRLACPARSLTGLQERGAAGAAARDRRAAPHPSPARAELGRPAVFTALIERLATENNGWGTSGSRANCSSSVTRLAHRPSAAS